MADKSPNHQCARGQPCGNVDALRVELGERMASIQGDLRVVTSKVEDLRIDLSMQPEELRRKLANEREVLADRLRRGDSHFQRIFTAIDDLKLDMLGRFARVEKSIVVLWIIVGMIAVGKVAVLLWPSLSSFVP